MRRLGRVLDVVDCRGRACSQSRGRRRVRGRRRPGRAGGVVARGRRGGDEASFDRAGAEVDRPGTRPIAPKAWLSWPASWTASASAFTAVPSLASPRSSTSKSADSFSMASGAAAVRSSRCVGSTTRPGSATSMIAARDEVLRLVAAQGRRAVAHFVAVVDPGLVAVVAISDVEASSRWM